jgi:regulator of replication initiation timing
MNKKQVIVVLIASFFLGASAYAKQKQEPQQQLSADDIVAKMKTQLGLTDKQLDGVKPIIEDYLAQEKKLKLEEKKQLSKVLTGGQMFTWNFLQNEAPREKVKKKK